MAMESFAEGPGREVISEDTIAQRSEYSKPLNLQ
jgi:hypothetical protein